MLRFVRLADAGYYNGVSFDRLMPNTLVESGTRAGGIPAIYSSQEAGTWPHVRGTVGLSAFGTDDAPFFVNLVDNPGFNHRYTVFAQVLNGGDVVDRILEGDVIESIEILP
jgi:peptidyl-prolyl cis-trans isomerase B (cyclophilin B)